MLRKIILLTIIAAFTFSCKKNTDSNNSNAIIGNWRYINSTADTVINGQWTTPQTGYDSSIVSNFADSLQFTATDTVYYTYYGITTWSNYKVEGNHLILIGSADRDTLTIHTLNNTTLQVGEQNSNNSYWATFTRY